jgi:uncharacterized RDD family membrane protein YckC
MDWYYVKDGSQVGPLPVSDLRARVTSGEIGPQTLVWAAGMSEWRPWSEVQETVVDGPGAGVTCSRCGRTVPPSETIQFGGRAVCAACKPAFVQGLKEGVAMPGAVRYGGFWIRLAARVIDGIVLWLINALVSAPLILAFFGTVTPGQAPTPDPGKLGAFFALYGLVMLLQIAVSAAYEVLFLGRFGATPGKMACGLRVMTAECHPVSYGRAFGRYFGTWLSGLTLGIGYIMAAFDDQKRSLHDRVCDTRVIKK